MLVESDCLGPCDVADSSPHRDAGCATQADPVLPTAVDSIAFSEDGYVIVDKLISRDFCSELNERLELVRAATIALRPSANTPQRSLADLVLRSQVLRGQYDIEGGRPDKAPTFRAEQRCKPGKTPPALGGPSKTTLQVINVWKADTAFRRLVTSPTLGRAVAQLAGWPGARVANDQVWAKPPGAAPLTFHRDSAYFDFTPADVVTVWVALDDMEAELGPLEYVRGSHRWAEGRVGSANQFFDARDRFALLHDAARRQGIADPASSLDVVPVSVRAGGCGIHNGRLWHGSGRNASPKRPRRGLGIHFVPADARFREAEGRTLAHGIAAAHAKARRGSAADDAVPSDASPRAHTHCDDEQRLLLPELFPVTWLASGLPPSN